ncbi:MAG: hypothetical protein J6W09_02905, partial [Bacteroidales bacterium]|nr:hypothetical protein [Bacteroidales bacterium]
MKKIYSIISILALAAIAVGCAKEESDIQNKELEQASVYGSAITVVLNVPKSPDTKTTLGTKNGSTYPVYWASGDGDLLSLNGSAPTSSTKNSDTEYKASFKPASLSVYNFLYRGDAGHDNQVTFPSTQNYVANGFDSSAMPMYAASASRPDNVTFTHLGALLKFSITGSKKIDSVTLSASESLSGTFTIGKTSSGLLDGTLTATSSGATLMYSFGGHIQLSSTPFVFYVAIPAGTYEDGITLDIVDNSSGHMTLYVMTEAGNKTIEAGKVREFSTVEYAPATEANLKQIYDVATFQEFVNAVAGGNKTLNARLTLNASSLNLSSIAGSFASIEDYAGTFDGNGKTLDFGTSTATQPLFATLKGVVKNLTLTAKIEETSTDNIEVGMFARRVQPSNEIDDIAGLQNCTANGSVTYTPSGAIADNKTVCVGGMVGNNKGGSFANCTNNATVTFANNGAGSVHNLQPSIGGVLGRTQKGGDLSTQGDISNCTNAGTVVCDAKFDQNIYLGGVVGYGVEKAESMSGCTNSGLVKATASCSTGQALHIGGVAGLYKGSIESCSNLTAGTVTTEACSAGTYLCQGGVIGRLNYDGTDGRVYETLSNAGTLNVAALGGSSARFIGGVVGRCNQGAGLNGVTNSGNINYTSEDTHTTYIGGVVASNNDDCFILENCSSTGGTLTLSSASHSGGIYVGGVVGYATKDVTSCSSAMTITTTGSMSMGSNSYICFGGVIGYMNGAVTATNCTNSGPINYGQTVTDEGQTYVGGVAGALTGAEISGGGNSGTLTFSGQNTKRPLSVGGIVGRVFSNTVDSGYALSNNVTNSGAIVVNSSVSGSQYMYLGGLVGQHLAGNIYGTNDAPITVTELHESMMALGGIVGYLAGGTVSNGTNTANGDIAVNGYVAGYHSYVGGIVGIASGGSSIAAGGGTITGATNAGDVTVAVGCTIPRNNYVGGIIGYAGNDVSNASNTGNVVNNYSQGSGSNGTSYHMNIAGVAAHSVADLTDCYNTGNVTNNGSTYKSEINVSGVVGISEGNLTRCSNGTNSLAGGTITNTATSGTNSRQDGQFAGVISNNKGNTTVTSCFNKGAVQNSGACSSISIGGVVAWTTGGTTTYTG